MSCTFSVEECHAAIVEVEAHACASACEQILPCPGCQAAAPYVLDNHYRVAPGTRSHAEHKLAASLACGHSHHLRCAAFHRADCVAHTLQHSGTASACHISLNHLVAVGEINPCGSLRVVGHAQIELGHLASAPPYMRKLAPQPRVGIVRIVFVYDIAYEAVGRRRLHAKPPAIRQAAHPH